MKCPYCNHEMEDGTLQGNQCKIRFVPSDDLLRAGRWMKRCVPCIHCAFNCEKKLEDMVAKSAIPLGKSPFIRRARITGVWHCSKCKKFILNVP